ncbi:MAG: hypothetical protein LBR47_07150, partial [Spirochaetaceae bacterium]|nr:hypothetical protein [Spirochaetaceae bacterium]
MWAAIFRVPACTRKDTETGTELELKRTKGWERRGKTGEQRGMELSAKEGLSFGFSEKRRGV